MRRVLTLFALLLSWPALAAPPCDAPEAWLALYTRDTIDAAWCAACSAGDSHVCDKDAAGRARMPWDLLRRSPQRYACDALAYVAQAIAAWHGHRVPADWADVFARQRWYRPRAEPSPLPAAAKDNIAWLHVEAAQCRATQRGVTADQRHAIAQWFAVRTAPPMLLVDGKRASEQAFRQFLRSDHLFEFDRMTPIVVSPADAFQVLFPGRPIRVRTVGTGAAPISCVGVDACEGFEWADFIFDAAGHLLAINLSAAG